MWYFSWILGVLLACSFAIINILWYEFQAGGFETDDELTQPDVSAQKEVPSKSGPS